MNTYYTTQADRPTPFVTDGLRRYSGMNNPQYVIGTLSAKQDPKQVKVELTSNIKKTLEQAKEEMVMENGVSKLKRKPSAKKVLKRRQTTVYKKTGTQIRSHQKNKPSKQHTKRGKRQHQDIFSNGSKKRKFGRA